MCRAVQVNQMDISIYHRASAKISLALGRHLDSVIGLCGIYRSVLSATKTAISCSRKSAYYPQILLVFFLFTDKTKKKTSPLLIIHCRLAPKHLSII